MKRKYWSEQTKLRPLPARCRTPVSLTLSLWFSKDLCQNGNYRSHGFMNWEPIISNLEKLCSVIRWNVLLSHFGLWKGNSYKYICNKVSCKNWVLCPRLLVNTDVLSHLLVKNGNYNKLCMRSIEAEVTLPHTCSVNIFGGGGAAEGTM